MREPQSKRPRTKPADERRADLLDAAEQVFVERGIAAARLDEITRRASVATGTLYFYFASKDDPDVSWLYTSIVVEDWAWPTCDITHLRSMARFDALVAEAREAMGGIQWEINGRTEPDGAMIGTS